MATLKAKLQRVEVTWKDATSDGGWSDVKNYRTKSTPECKTIGYLSRYDHEVIQLVQTRVVPPRTLTPKPTFDEQRVTDSLTIPRQWAIRVRIVR